MPLSPIRQKCSATTVEGAVDPNFVEAFGSLQLSKRVVRSSTSAFFRSFARLEPGLLPCRD